MFKSCLFLCLLTAVGLGAHSSGICAADQPRVLVEDCRLQRIAAEPEIVTPVGMAFNRHGSLLVIESHTHQRPEEYSGPLTDRIRILSDSDGDGMADQWSTFAEGFHQAMNLLPTADGKLYVVTRRDVVLLADDNADGIADRREQILTLQSPAEYPHNGLSGIVLNGNKLFVGLGDNFGAEYRMIGSDGSEVVDPGGKGEIFRASPRGENVERFATGFWNPFSLCFAGERLFCVDNDPDASPPCRLIDVLEGGDYGFRYDYGRAGVHPLQAWDGELPGTLPLVCGTGEAPTAVVFHRGYFWVTSWGDHRIERYQLVPDGKGSFTAKRNIVVQGESDFRPTGMAIAPDGSLYFSDWVDRSYPVHRQGRIWRLELGDMPAAKPPGLESAADLETRLAETTAASRMQPGEKLSPDADARMDELQHLHWQWRQDMKTLRQEDQPITPQLKSLLREALRHDHPDVRIYAVRWICDHRLTQFTEQVKQLLDAPPVSERYYLAILAAIDWLENEPTMRDSLVSNALVARELQNPRRSPPLKTFALKMITPDAAMLSPERLLEFLRSDYRPLRREAVRTLVLQQDPARFAVLAQIAQDDSLDQQLRADAVSGLGESAAHRELLESLADEDSTAYGAEAVRILRFLGELPPPREDRPHDLDTRGWMNLLASPGSANTGWRVFFSPTGPRCAACHQYEGRGSTIGPDLTRIGATASRKKVITSILQPSQEISPRYQPWILQTESGKTLLGQKLPQGGDTGREIYADANGAQFTVESESIVQRQASDTSIMPTGLVKTMSVDDLRNLVTLLLKRDDAQ